MVNVMVKTFEEGSISVSMAKIKIQEDKEVLLESVQKRVA
jgi:hypothetical protein